MDQAPQPYRFLVHLSISCCITARMNVQFRVFVQELPDGQVIVWPLGRSFMTRRAPSRLIARGSSTGPDKAPADGVVCLYSQGRHRYVKDPRTNLRVPNLAAVLQEGQIDAFLLAAAREAAVETI
jgi:hypothetical protein